MQKKILEKLKFQKKKRMKGETLQKRKWGLFQWLFFFLSGIRPSNLKVSWFGLLNCFENFFWSFALPLTTFVITTWQPENMCTIYVISWEVSFSSFKKNEDLYHIYLIWNYNRRSKSCDITCDCRKCWSTDSDLKECTSHSSYSIKYCQWNVS